MCGLSLGLGLGGATPNMVFSVIWYFIVTMITFHMTLLMHEWTYIVLDDR